MILGLAGYAGSGKDTLADQLADEGWQHLKFAGTLKEAALILNPWIINQHAPLQFLVDRYGWTVAKRDPEVRGFLQRLGTEVGRDLLGEDVWVEALGRKILDGNQNVVISDVRFPNEARFVQILLRIERPGCAPANDHPSETALDDWVMPIITNDSTPEAMLQAVERILGSAL